MPKGPSNGPETDVERLNPGGLSGSGPRGVVQVQTLKSESQNSFCQGGRNCPERLRLDSGPRPYRRRKSDALGTNSVCSDV